jgi:hypothetical protein
MFFCREKAHRTKEPQTVPRCLGGRQQRQSPERQVSVAGHRAGMVEPEDQEQAWESAEIADGLLVGRDSSAGSQPARRIAARCSRTPHCERRESPVKGPRLAAGMPGQIHADNSRQQLRRFSRSDPRPRPQPPSLLGLAPKKLARDRLASRWRIAEVLFGTTSSLAVTITAMADGRPSPPSPPPPPPKPAPAPLPLRRIRESE